MTNAEAIQGNIETVKTGRCPNCGSALKRNLAITGWWMCEQNGSGHYRARPNEPACGWQAFTE